MRPFSQVFDRMSGQVRQIVAEVQCPDPSRLEDLQAKSRTAKLELRELGELLEIGRSPLAGRQFDMLREFVLRMRRRTKQNAVRYVAPIYVSSYCADACPYCNFSVMRKSTPRKRLTIEELEREVRAVVAEGARVIELVYATDPELGRDAFIEQSDQSSQVRTKLVGALA
jgi:2-iminoacetate synthase